MPSTQSIFLASKITQNILDSGDVRVYLKIPSNNVIALMPYSDLYYEIKVGKLIVKVQGYATMNSGNFIWYVIIPGGTSIGSGRKAAVDYSNYEAVKKYYNLKD